MGQLVSCSSVIVEVASAERGRRPFFVEYNGAYVPAVEWEVAYAVRLNRDGGEVVCVLQGDGQSVEVVLERCESHRSYTFRLSRPCASGFYRLRCLDVNTVVYVSGTPGRARAPEAPAGGGVWLPDGVEFRKQIAGLEDSVASLQKSARWKTLLESLTRFSDLLRSLSAVCDSLLSVNVDFAGERDHFLKQLFNTDLHSWIKSFNEKNLLSVSQSLSRDVISPLQEFIEFERQSQKALPKKQKNFQEAVRLMYSSQSSLSFNSKRQFELARLDYQSFLYQCYAVGPPLRKLYNSVSLFLRIPVSDTDCNEAYMKKNHLLKSSIRNAQSLSDLTKLYSSINTPHLETYALVDFQENEHGSASSGMGGSNPGSSSQWHKKWIILDGNQLSILHHHKKIPMHTVDLSFACIKQVNRTTIEIQTSGLPSLLPALTAVSSSSSSVEYNAANSKNQRSKVYMQFKDHSEADRWLTVLRQANQDTKQYSNPTAAFSPLEQDSSTVNRPLIDLVVSQNESNSSCCDCGDSQTVEWISINLLCVLCIKCSGVHRSMGSHISKVRSLTLDSFTSPEVLHLLRNNVSNANVNSIYESNGSIETKITPQSSDSERSHYIINKYQARKMVSDGNQDSKASLKSLIKAIHLNSIYLLQKALAQSKHTLRDVVAEQVGSDSDKPTIFQYSLKHHEMIHGRPAFFITEFLLYNGLPVDRLPKDTSNWSPTVIEYWKNKYDMYGVFSPNTSNSKPHDNTDSNLASLSIPADKAPGRRWTLTHMPSSPQIKSPTNLLNMHKSLKLKKGSGSRKD